jgi:fructose-1,6-bisphosphatase/inositol monophosphatase family enzyme
MDLIQLRNIAIEAALSAGKAIKRSVNSDILVENKNGGTSYASQVVTAVDRECETEILSHLQPTCMEFELGLISEESEDDTSRFTKDYFWSIDPMDGTLAFINGRPGFSVSIALVAKDGTPQIGVVYDPCTENLYHAVKGHGAFKNDNPWLIENNNEYLTFVSDRGLRHTAHADEITSLLNSTVAHLSLNGVKELVGGGAVLNAIHVLENGPALMLKLPKRERGGGSIWDYAATVCIYHELGLPATNFEGGQLDLNRKDGTFMNHQGVFYANLVLPARK